MKLCFLRDSEWVASTEDNVGYSDGQGDECVHFVRAICVALKIRACVQCLNR